MINTEPDLYIEPLDLAGEIVTVTEERWPALSIIEVDAPTISLPVGRWLLITQISTSPADIAGPALTKIIDTTLLVPTEVAMEDGTLYAYRDLGVRDTIVYIRLSIHERVGSQWIGRHAILHQMEIPSADEPITTQGFGAGVHLFIPTITGDAPRLRKWLDRMVEAGADTVHTSIPISYLVPTSHVFNVTAAASIDTFMADCASRNLDVIVTLGMTCDEDDAPWLGGTTPNPWPANLSDVDTYITNVLNRWDFSAIQSPVNEPNNPNKQPEMSADRVMRVLSRVYTVAKAHTPAMPVLAGPLAYGDVPFLEEMYDNGLAGKHDGVAIHPYHVRFDGGTRIGDPHFPWERDVDELNTLGPWLPAVTETYRLMREHNEGHLPVYFTEGNWSSTVAGTPGFRCSEAQQAEYLGLGLRQMSRCPWVEAVVIFMAYDDEFDIDPTVWNWWGLVRRDGQTKPAWTAWKDAVAAIRAA